MADSAGLGKKSVAKRPAPTHPKWYDMVIEAIGDNTDSKGASVQAIKTYISGKYPTVDQSAMKHSIRRALDKGLDLKVLKRPKSSEEATGLTGRFKLDKTALKAETKVKTKVNAKVTKPKKATASVDVTPPKAKSKKASKEVKATKAKPAAKKQLLVTPKATKPKPKKAELKTPKKSTSALKSKTTAKKTPTVKATKKKATPKKSKGKTTSKSKS